MLERSFRYLCYSFHPLVCVIFLFAFLAGPQLTTVQGDVLSDDEVQIIGTQFKLYETFVQGNLQQYMSLWALDAEFRAGGWVYKGKEEIEPFAKGLMDGKPQSLQSRVVLTIEGNSATVSTQSLFAGTPVSALTEMDIVYRYTKTGDRWLIQVEDTDLPHIVELFDAAFDQKFRDEFYPTFQQAIEGLDQGQIASFTATDVKVIAREGQKEQGVQSLVQELERTPLIFQDDVYINREDKAIAVFKTKDGNALLDFHKPPDGQLTLREVDFSFGGLESVTSVHPIGKSPTPWGRMKTMP